MIEQGLIEQRRATCRDCQAQKECAAVDGLFMRTATMEESPCPQRKHTSRWQFLLDQPNLAGEGPISGCCDRADQG